MKRRGRPAYPDILTPRQQEVLALLREGLTNPQIAERLGISLDGAKFLVGEVISRLGVADRTEAARWQPAAAAPAAAPRLAWALAPFVLLRKITPSWLPPAASGTILVAALAGVGVLTWAVVSTGGGGTHVVAPTATAGPAPMARTGIPALDATIDKLVRRDLNGLLDLVQFQTIGCSVEQTVGSPPPCATGVADGTPLQAFPLGSCEGTYATTIDQVSQAFGLALLRQPSAALFAVVRDNSPDRADEAYWVAITQDRPSQGAADVSFWRVNADGRVVRLQNDCGPVGAAQQVAYRFPAAGHPDFLLGPFISCSPPPGETPNFMVTVDGLSPGSVLPQFWGEAISTLGEDTGERAIVTIRPDTNWIGDINRLEDVRPGMELEAVGVRQPDCTIIAQTILTPAPNTLHSDALGIELQYPFNWHEGAPPMPYASCMNCTTLGPKDVPYPYGVSIFTFPHAPPPGDTAGSYCTIRCLDAGAGGPRTLSVAGVDASQVEMLRQPPVGLTNETGETTLYHEIWTMVPRSDDALLLVWFFRDGDAIGKQYVRRSMDAMLKSLVLLPRP